jgi:hypothetical protein
MRPTGRRQRFRRDRAGDDGQGARIHPVPARGLPDVGRASLRYHQCLCLRSNGPGISLSAQEASAKEASGSLGPAAGAKVAPLWLNLR